MSDPTPRLSILVPTYNYATYIGEALRSVLDQGVEGVEIVVADDGSTDGTAEALRPWVESGAVQYFSQPNQGPSAARNLALRQSRGDLLMFLDADDVLLPGCLATTLDFLQRHPEVGLFFTNYDIFDAQGVVTASGVDIWRIFRQIAHREVRPKQWIFTESLAPYIIQYGAFMHTSGLTLRREVADRIGPFREGFFYGEDDEYYARAAYVAEAGYVDEVLSRKRNHSRSLIHDAAHGLRNSRHLLELTEIQREAYRDDPRLRRILDEKAKGCAIGCAWWMIETGEPRQARALLRRYLARHPLSWPIHKLLAKSVLKRRR